MTRPAPSCFSQDNTRADGFSGHEIYAQMTGGPGTGSAQNAANKAAELERTYAGVEARLKKVGETLGEAWTGTSADAAQAAGNPIKQAMVQMQDALRQADHSLSNQVYQFNYNKGQLKDMPASKPDTGFWDDVSPWDTDAEDAVNKYNSEESHNRKVYSEFQSASNTNRGDLPKEFPGVTADSLNVEVITSNESGGDKTTNTSSTGRPTGTGSGFPSTTGSPQGPTGTGWTPPGDLNGDRTDTSWVSGGDDGRGGGPGKPGELGPGKPPIGGVIDRPPNTGIPPIGVPVGTG
ncbi:WXG100 family type VII secretion target, partial [Lentzea sp. PSKA42]